MLCEHVLQHLVTPRLHLRAFAKLDVLLKACKSTNGLVNQGFAVPCIVTFNHFFAATRNASPIVDSGNCQILLLDKLGLEDPGKGDM